MPPKIVSNRAPSPDSLYDYLRKSQSHERFSKKDVHDDREAFEADERRIFAQIGDLMFSLRPPPPPPPSLIDSIDEETIIGCEKYASMAAQRPAHMPLLRPEESRATSTVQPPKIDPHRKDCLRLHPKLHPRLHLLAISDLVELSRSSEADAPSSETQQPSKVNNHSTKSNYSAASTESRLDISTADKSTLGTINLHLTKSCALLANNEPDRALTAANQALKLATKSSIPHSRAKSQLYRGLALKQMKQWEKAGVAFAEAANQGVVPSRLRF